MANHTYVTRLPEGRYLAVELPDDSAELDSTTGELILQPPAIQLLDRLRALLSALPPNATAGRLRMVREALGFSPEELAAELGVELSELADWESGHASPTPDQLAAIERVRARAVRRGVVLPEDVCAS